MGRRYDLSPHKDEILQRAARRLEIGQRKYPHLDRPWVKNRAILGVMGEVGFAVATHQKIQPEQPDDVLDGGKDFQYPGGQTVDTKGRRTPHRDMLYELEGQMKADWYVVVECDDQNWWAEPVGCCTRQMLIDAEVAPERITRNSTPAKIIYECNLLRCQSWMVLDKEVAHG